MIKFRRLDDKLGINFAWPNEFPLHYRFVCVPRLVQLYFSKVQKLISWSQDLGKSGTVYLQSVQSHAVDVSTKWRKAVEVATNRKNCLQEALTFHVKLFEVCLLVA